jgi:hypothetical protein
VHAHAQVQTPRKLFGTLTTRTATLAYALAHPDLILEVDLTLGKIGLDTALLLAHMSEQPPVAARDITRRNVAPGPSVRPELRPSRALL